MPIFVCQTVCWHRCHKPSEITIKISLTIPHSTRFVLELEFGRTSPAKCQKNIIYNAHLFCLHIIPYAIFKKMTGGSSWSYSQSFNVAMYSQRQPQYMRYRRWNHRSISAVCPETKSDVPGRPRTTESVDVKNWMSCGSFPCKLEAVI